MKGILFKAEMVCAILEGRKTMTRRVIKEMNTDFLKDKNIDNTFYNPETGKPIVPHPKYKVGEIIYVKETYFNEMNDNKYLTFYKADNINIGGYSWKSSMFMPEKYSRIKLQIENIRVVRVQDTSLDDMESEGIKLDVPYKMREAWIKLWNSINKPPYAWADNPYIFCYEFKVVK